MDYQYVLKRAWHILWRYKVLWLFGFLVALTTCQGGLQGQNYGDNVSYQLDSQDWAQLKELQGIGPAFRELEQLFRFSSPDEILPILVGTLLVIAGLAILWLLLAAVLRYVSETALIRLVNDYEKSGETLSIRQGWRTGWSRTAWRFFLIDLIVRLPVSLVFLALFVLALTPLLLWLTGVEEVAIAGTIFSGGLFLFLLFLALAVNAVLNVLTPFFRRVCALEGQGVLASISQGFSMVRQNLKDVVLMAVILFVISAIFVILLIPASLLLIPVALLLLLPGALVGGAAALVAGGLASLVFDGLLPWVAAGVAGLPLLFLVVALPWLFLRGLWEVYVSSAWTLTYRQLKGLAPAGAPVAADIADLKGMAAEG